MSDPKSAPVSTPVGAAHSFGPIPASFLEDIGKQLGRVRSGLGEHTQLPTLARAELVDAEAKVVAKARELRQEFAAWEEAQFAADAATSLHFPPVRGDEAVMADLLRTGIVQDDPFGDHKHTPTDHMQAMKSIERLPSGYLVLDQSEAIARAKVRRSRRWFDPRRYVSADSLWSTATVIVLVGFVGGITLAALDVLGVVSFESVTAAVRSIVGAL